MRGACGKRAAGVREAPWPTRWPAVSYGAMAGGHSGHGWRCGGIKAKDGGLLQTVEQGCEPLPPGCQGRGRAHRAPPLPPRARTAQLRPPRLAPGAAQLLGLVHPDRQPQQPGQHASQRRRAMSVGRLPGRALGVAASCRSRGPSATAPRPPRLRGDPCRWRAPGRPPAQGLDLVRGPPPQTRGHGPARVGAGLPRPRRRQAAALPHPSARAGAPPRGHRRAPPRPAGTTRRRPALPPGWRADRAPAGPR